MRTNRFHQNLRPALLATLRATAGAGALAVLPAHAGTGAEATPQAATTEQRATPRLGPLSFGGAMRVNYVQGSYTTVDDGPSRGNGDFELDTFRINVALDYRGLIGKLEYRWYQGYNFIHTGWIGYRTGEDSQLQAGITRVPFGPGPYGVSQSWFFDQHYYVGLSDDMDLGIVYHTRRGRWAVAVGYFPRSEGNGNGTSADSARYGYDVVRWNSGTNADGTVVAAPVNGYDERHQVNLRAIYHLGDDTLGADLGASVQAGQLRAVQGNDGSHWAASLHAVMQARGVTLAAQLSRYAMAIDSDNAWGSDALIPMGAYDFAWPAATHAWVPAVSLSYQFVPGSPGWLDAIRPYIEFSSLIKDEGSFNDSNLLVIGAAWAVGGWHIYSDLAVSDGNLFIGNEGDDYSNIYNGVGDFGADGNDRRNYRFNLNVGYYF